jgi:hypothetical protein
MSTDELQQLESLLVRALPDPRGFADRVLGQLLDRVSGGSPVVQPITVVQPAGQEHGDLMILLAAALGACECWGRDPGCGLCNGDGGPGWIDPEEDLYAEYVRPAVQRRAGTVSSAATNSRPDRPVAEEGVRP